MDTIDWNDFRAWVKVQADADRTFRPDHTGQCAIATYLTDKGIAFDHVSFDAVVRHQDDIIVIPDDISEVIRRMSAKGWGWIERHAESTYAEFATQLAEDA